MCQYLELCARERAVMDSLYEYQRPHAERVATLLGTHGRVLDASDTGTGKTFCALAVCRMLDLRPLIVCPKSVLTAWQDAARQMGMCNPTQPCILGLANYEMLSNVNWLALDAAGAFQKMPCPHLSRRTGVMRPHPSNAPSGDTTATYMWRDLPADALLVFDEVHRCKNPRIVASVLLYTAAETDARILMLSATAADTPAAFENVGFALRLYPSMPHASNWIRTTDRANSPRGAAMVGVHHKLFGDNPGHAARMRIKDLGARFPQNQVLAQAYNMPGAEDIQQQYAIIAEEVARLRRNEDNCQCVLARIVYARMRIEQLKVPFIVDMARELLQEQCAVAIFVNFNNSLDVIARELGTRAVVHGRQTREERDAAIADFQADRARAIVLNMRSGGVGISLHDTRGAFPRVTLVCPSWSAQDVVQALGRCHRAGGRTPVRQRVLFCADTVEESLCANMRAKLENIGGLNDGDRDALAIPGLAEPDLARAEGLATILDGAESREVRLATLQAQRAAAVSELALLDEAIAALQ